MPLKSEWENRTIYDIYIYLYKVPLDFRDVQLWQCAHIAGLSEAHVVMFPTIPRNIYIYTVYIYI
jgi:hypothetical protein